MELFGRDTSKAVELAAKAGKTIRGAANLAVKSTVNQRKRLAGFISPEQAQEARLAYIDTTTGAANERAFNKRLESLIDTGNPFAVIAIDVNKFKNVNDLVGHKYADSILRQFVEGLDERIRDEDKVFTTPTLFRTGGDEFILLAPLEAHKDTDYSYEERLDMFLGRLNEEYFNGHEFTAPNGTTLTISATAFGNVMYPDQALDADNHLNDLFVNVLEQKKQS